MSDESRRSGSSSFLTFLHLSSSGYISGRSSGRTRESLAKYTRPPASTTTSSSRSSNRAKPEADAGMSSARVHPGIGKDNGAGLEEPNRFRTAKKDADRARL